MEFALRIEPYPHDPAQAKRLLAEAGYPNGFDAGDVTPLPPFTTMGEALSNSLAAVGIRTRVRSMERASYMEAWRAKKLQGLILTVTAAQGNAASRIEAFVVSSSPYAYGGYPDIDDLFRTQAQERDRKRRGAAASDSAPHARAGHARADLRARHTARGGTTGRGAGDWPESATVLRRTLRGHPPEEAVREPDIPRPRGGRHEAPRRR